MVHTEVKVSEWLQEGFNLYKTHFGVLILTSLVAVLLSAATLGVLAGPMMAGFFLISLSLYDRREPKPMVGDVFKGFSYFLHSLAFMLGWGLALMVASMILGIIPVIGQLASLALCFVAQAFLMFGLPLIVEQRMGFWEASKASIDMVKSNVGPFLGLGVVASIIGGLGALACGIGVVVTLPIQICVTTVAYRNVFRTAVAPPPPPEPGI